MARAKSKPPTEKQQEILGLYARDPDITPAEIADRLNLSATAIYQQVSRLRKAGHLPKQSSRRNGRRARPAPAPAPDNLGVIGLPPKPDEIPPVAVASNGGQTLEDHLASELRETVQRIDVIGGELDKLTAEQRGLTHRREKLTAAEEALTSS